MHEGSLPWPRWAGGNIWREGLMLAAGVLFVAASARMSISLPFTVVPITGQTFGVMVLGLVLGGVRAGGAMVLTVLLGLSGLPVFADGAGGEALVGPTGGYLGGMVVAAYGLGRAVEHHACRGWVRAFVACLLASAVVLALGLGVLALYVPLVDLLAVGLWPFLPGNLIKCIAAAVVGVVINERFTKAAAR